MIFQFFLFRLWLAVLSPSKDAKTSVIIMKINKFACRDGPV